MSTPGTPFRPIVSAYQPATDKKPIYAFGVVIAIAVVAAIIAL